MISYIDNLVLVHAISSRLTMIYDIKGVHCSLPVVTPTPLAPMYVRPRKLIEGNRETEIKEDQNVACRPT